MALPKCWSTLQEYQLAPNSTETQSSLFSVFGRFLGLLWLHFSLKKIDCTIMFSKFGRKCQIGAFRHALSIWFPKKKKKNHLHHWFQKWERGENLIKSRFFKVMHSSFKLWAFGYPLSPLSGTKKKKITHSFSNKKERKILFKK